MAVYRDWDSVDMVAREKSVRKGDMASRSYSDAFLKSRSFCAQHRWDGRYVGASASVVQCVQPEAVS